MVEAARACCDAVSIPVIGDADTGYGGTLSPSDLSHYAFCWCVGVLVYVRLSGRSHILTPPAPVVPSLVLYLSLSLPPPSHRLPLPPVYSSVFVRVGKTKHEYSMQNRCRSLN